ATHGSRARHRQHRGRERVGDLLLDDLRRLSGVGRAEDLLNIGRLREGVNGPPQHRPQAPGRKRSDCEQHRDPVGDTGANGASNHCRRASVALRLASEPIRNCPETTTLWPTDSPDRISVCPPPCVPVSTLTGRNLPSPSDSMTTCRVPVSMTASLGTIRTSPPITGAN